MADPTLCCGSPSDCIDVQLMVCDGDTGTKWDCDKCPPWCWCEEQQAVEREAADQKGKCRSSRVSQTEEG